MIKYYRTMDHQIHEISEPMEGTWISLIHPTAAELAKIATDYKIDIDDLRAPLDEEERSHIEVEEGYTLFIVDVPTTEERKEKEYFLTIPCGIILTEKVIITVCLEDTAVLADFKNGRVRNFWTFKRTRFIFRSFIGMHPCICSICESLIRRVILLRSSFIFQQRTRN